MKIAQLWRCFSLFAIFSALFLSGCAAPPAFEVSQPMTRVGTVESIRSQTVQNSNAALGTIGGALIGGLLGNQVGRGSGRTAATVVGAAGGAYAGNVLASGNTSLVWIIGIRYDDGSLAMVQQASSPAVRIGDRVRVSNNGMELLPN